jgi:hypothetical protein
VIALLSLGALCGWGVLATLEAIRTDDHRRLPDRA